MASRQLLRRLSPLLRHTRLMLTMRHAVHTPRQAILNQDLAARLSGFRCMSSSGPPEIINIQDEEDFKKRVIDADKPVVLDFHATWCGPCKMLGPLLEMIVTEEKGRVVLAKVDIDQHMEIAMRYNVKSVPAVYGMKGGKVKFSFIGLQNDDQIKSFVQGL